MPIPIAAAAGVSLIPSAFKFIQGISQMRRANAMRPSDPGFQMNNAVIDNARMQENRFGNYMLPGYGAARADIQNNGATAFNTGIQGASSGGDVLDLASKIAYGSNAATNNLAVQNARGREAAYNDYLRANEAAGQQYQDKNAWERERYMQQLREKAALYEGGVRNMYSSADTAANVGQNLIASGLGSQPSEIPRVSPVNVGISPVGSIPSNRTDYTKWLQQRFNL